MAAIRTSAEVLADENLEQKDRTELSNAITGEVDHLQTLLNGVRNISRIDAEDVFAGSEIPALPVNEYLRSVISRLQDKYKGVSFEFFTDNDSINLVMPEDYIYRISENLIENAAGFGTKVKVSSKTVNDKKKASYILTVEDNGKGVSEESKAKIFDRFYSERSSENNSENHTGLGLSIVKAIVDSLEGEITVGKSEELGGASFKIKLDRVK